MSQQRKKFDEESKHRAVQLSYSGERSVKDVAYSLGIGSSLLHRWRRQFTPTGDQIQLSALEAKNRKLRVCIAEFENEVDLQNLASVYFAKYPR